MQRMRGMRVYMQRMTRVTSPCSKRKVCMALRAAGNQEGPGCGGSESLSFSTSCPSAFTCSEALSLAALLVQKYSVYWLYWYKKRGMHLLDEAELEQQRVRARFAASFCVSIFTFAPVKQGK